MTWDEIEPYIKLNKNGELSIFGKLLTYWLTHAFLNKKKEKKLNEYLKNPKIIENVQNQKNQILFLSNIIDIWVIKAHEIKQSIWFKWSKNDDNII
jgi:hypothetical protein